MSFTREHKTGDIVTQFPLSSAIFKKYKIDFCCGGNRPIEQSAKEKNIDVDSLLSEINALYNTASAEDLNNNNWDEASVEEIIDTVVNRYHTSLFQQLPEIGQYVTKIMRVHGVHHPELVKLYDLFNEFKTEMETHAIDEEQRVFPLMMKLKWEPNVELLPQIRNCIEELDEEHNAAGNLLERMREVTYDYLLPVDACKTYELTFKKLIELENETFMHVHLENNILFPKVLS